MEIDAEVAEKLYGLNPGDLVNEWRLVARHIYGWEHEERFIPFREQTVQAWLVLRHRTLRDLYGIRYTRYPAPNETVGLPWSRKSGPLELTPLREVTTISYAPRGD